MNIHKSNGGIPLSTLLAVIAQRIIKVKQSSAIKLKEKKIV